jgi:hypothetical protein
MKKYLILFWIISLAASLLSTQLFVVGEVFTATWCGFCPAARSALRQMDNQSDDFEYLIPLIWQQDGPYPSPNYGQRTSLYSVSGIPHGQWGGHLSYVGGGAATYSNYVQRYNQLVSNPSPIEIELDFEITGQNQLHITADVELIQSLTTTNNKILFIVSYNLDAEQPGDYFASVMRYNEQDFTLTSSGQTGEISHIFDIDPSWDLAKANAVVIIQTFSGNKTIHQAASSRLSDLIAPSGLVGYPGNNQALLTWNPPDTALDILGYNIYRDNVVINDQPYGETTYTDTGLENDTPYSYFVTAVYDEDESGPSNIVSVTPFAAPPGLIQIGSGENVNTTTQAAPVNVYYRSQRGQMVYTADEINSAGFEGPGDLSYLGFYIHASPVHNLPDFHIRIKHTNASNAASHDGGPYEMTQVITSYSPTAGIWDMIELVEPFFWNGEDNILIDTAFDLVPNWNASGQLRVFNFPAGYRYSWNDNSSQVNVGTTNVVDYKPQIRLQFDDDPPPDLPVPENLSALAFDGLVELFWEAPDPRNLLGYNVYRDDNQINTEIVTETEYSDSEVANNITYSYFVSAVYDSGESAASNTVETTPLAAPHSLAAEVVDTYHVLLLWEAPDRSVTIDHRDSLKEDVSFLIQKPETASLERDSAREIELTGYNIYRDDVLLAQNDAETVSFLDEDLEAGIYSYFVTAIYGDLESVPSEIAEIEIVETSSSDHDSDTPYITELHRNYPNPFNPDTTIEFSLAQSGFILLEIYNNKGQRVKNLLAGYREAGNYQVVWNGKDNDEKNMPSGVYLYRLITEERNVVRKMLMLK